jgi:hypothetical protein
MTIRRHSRHPLAAALIAASVFCLVLAGCEEKMRSKKKAAATTPPPSQAPAPATDDGFIVGKRTQDVRNAGPEIQNGAQVATQTITARDPITLQGNAYVTMIGKTSILQIDHAMNLYKATNDRYPKDYDEFMAEIIKANNIALPKLPPYQKYGYNEEEHKLVVLEYPELKNAPAPRSN